MARLSPSFQTSRSVQLMDYKKLAVNHSDIWWTHDSKNFEQLTAKACNLLLLLGYGRKSVLNAATHISKSYEYYDLAVEASDNAVRSSYFKKVQDEHRQVMLILDKRVLLGDIYFYWWKYFYLRNPFGYILLLLAYHLISFPPSKIPFAFLSCVYISAAGVFGHNKRNKKIAEFYLEEYWRVVDRAGLSASHIIY